MQEVARQHGVTVSYLIREAIGDLEGLFNGTKPATRLKRIMEEFMFAAMAQIIDDQHPCLRKELITDASTYVDSMEN